MRVDKSKWERKTLKDIGTIISGATPRTDNPLNWGNQYNWVTPAELKGEKYIGRTQKQITDHALSKTKLTLMPPGTVLLSSRAPIGKVAITTEPMYCNQGFKNIVCGNKFFNGFLYYYLIANQDELNRKGNGVTFKEVSKKIVEAFPVIVPSFYEQQAIATELDAVQAMIDGYKAQIADLDALARSIFLDMFGDPISNPKGWEKCRIDSLSSTSSGGTPSKSKTEYYENGNVLWLRSGEVCKHYIFDTEIKITDLGLSNSSAKLFPKETVVVAMYGATAGQVGILKTEMSTNQAICGIYPSSKVHNEYLYYCLIALNTEIVKQAGGAAQPNISQTIIKSLSIPLPPLTLQQHFATQVEAIEKQKELLRQQLADAEILMAERMQYYFS